MAIWKRLTEVIHAGRLDRELDQEVTLHLTMLEEDFRRRGMSAEAARDAARREFGGVSQSKEAYCDERGAAWLDAFLKDVRYAARGLRRNPGFAAAAVLSLALGIGANTAIFSMYHALMMRMLPVAHPEKLLSLYRTGGWGSGISSYPLYQEVAKHSDLFSGVIARSSVEKVRLAAATADREFVSGNYFSVLGIAPALGRLFTDEDTRTAQANPQAVLSYEFWQNRFGGDPGALGRTFVADKQTVTIIGVAGPGFRGVELERRPDFWEPLTMAGNDLREPGLNWLWMIARRRPEIARARVQSVIDALLKRHLEQVYGQHPNAGFRRTAMDQHIEVRDAATGLSSLRAVFGKPLAVLLGAVGLVLLASCANVANLLMARGAARRRETALRFSLGATRARLIRQALTESLMLAGAGAALGGLLALWGERAILQFLPVASGNPFQERPDAAVLFFSLAVSLLSAILFGLAPALRSTAIDPAAALHSGAGQTHGGQPLFRKVLVASQVAFSAVLVLVAGLFSQSLAALRAIDLGFQNREVVTFSMTHADDATAEQRRSVRERLLARIAAVPGVSSVSFASPGPFQAGMSNSTVQVPGSPLASREPAWVSVQRVAPHFFETLGSTPRMGREIDRNDAASGARVAVVNEAFLRKFLPGEAHPLDRVLSFGEPDRLPTHIVGVVRDIPHQGLREPAAPTVYLPVAGHDPSFGTVTVRVLGAGGALVQAIRTATAAMGPEITASEPRPLSRRIDDSIFEDRMLATVGGFFGTLALLLAAVGLYGVISYGMAQRSGEIGVRLALGASRSDVFRMVLRDALLLVGAGLAAGLPAGLAAGRYVASLLVGVKPANAAAFFATAGVLLTAGLVAAFLPARRAASLDPMRALRHE